MTRAAELIEDAEKLASAIRAYASTHTGPGGHKNSFDALSLIDLEIKKLRALDSGRSPMREWNVYLSTSSLNKGLIEVGGEWRDNAHLVRMANALTDKAYTFYKETRPS